MKQHLEQLGVAFVFNKGNQNEQIMSADNDCLLHKIFELCQRNDIHNYKTQIGVLENYIWWDEKQVLLVLIYL